MQLMKVSKSGLHHLTDNSTMMYGYSGQLVKYSYKEMYQVKHKYFRQTYQTTSILG